MQSDERRDIYDRLLLHATMAEDSIKRRQQAIAEYTLAHYESALFREAAREIENLRAQVKALQSRQNSSQ
jgi:polyhydroxyalkanoate synthesis regulator phasin